MSGIILVFVVFFGLAGGLGVVAFVTYRRKLRRAKAIERGLKMVPVLIHLPPPSSDTAAGSRDIREVMREKTSQAEVLYNLLAGTAVEGFKSNFYGQRHVALELIAIEGVVHFFVAVPVALVSVVKKAVVTAYPGARLEEVEDHNIFNQEGRLAATLGGEMVLRAESAYPIATYAKLERDPMEALLTTIAALDKQDGAAVQIMLRPADPKWTKRSVKVADSKRKGRHESLAFTAGDLVKAAVKSPEQRRQEEQARTGGKEVSNLELAEVEAIEEKTKHPGFEVLVRVVVSTGSVVRSQQLLRDIATAFALFEAPGVNGFKFLPALDVQGLVTAFIFRFFPPELKSNVLNSVELATLFHLPDSQFTPSASVERLQSKQVDGPVQLPATGLLFGHNEFRGVQKEIRLSPEDRRRHTYILGQTGTGKSTMLENLVVQDMRAGNGFAFIDPHGDSAEKLLSMVPKERAEDVVYFNPSDMEYPLGLNLFEFTDPAQKDFLVQETINMLYKLYDPGHTGIIGPRYEHWYRNAALTLMSDPNGATFIEIPKVFTDTEYLKKKFKYLKDPTVIDFWTKEMGQTSDYHKSEMLGWFVSKFGAFQNNEMMRNIIGQTKSAFNIRDIMDQKKILIVNLSKGRIGELNSQLLGMIFVIKFQAAAMSRAEVPEDQRADFCLYVDEFQNFSTDSFASILSEARKYRLNLIVANQFIGQLSQQIRDAVFGNIGTIVAHRMGPEDAEFMVKQFAPVFDASDLMNLPNFNAAMRLMIGGLPSQPFTIKDSAPIAGANAELGVAIKQLSAAKFGRAKSVVEADIVERFTGRAPGTPAPKLSTPVAPGAAGGAGSSVSGPGAGGASGPAGGPGASGAGSGVGAPNVSGTGDVASGGMAPAGARATALGGSGGMSGSAMNGGSAVGATGVGGSGAVNGAGVVGASGTAPATAAMVPPAAGGASWGNTANGAVVAAGASGVPGADFASVGGMAPGGAGMAGGGVAAAPSTQVGPGVGAVAGTWPAVPVSGAAGGYAAPGADTALGSGSVAGSAASLPQMAMMPPPIGAPPVDLPPSMARAVGPMPGAAVGPGAMVGPMPGAAAMPGAATAGVAPAVAAAAVPPAPGTLSFRDITGGRPPRQAPVAVDSAMSGSRGSGAGVGVPAGGESGADGSAMVAGAAPLPGDPYAGIDVLGMPAPRPTSEPAVNGGAVGGGAMGMGGGVAQPLPGDPYAGIDVLGGAVPAVGLAAVEPAVLAAPPVGRSVEQQGAASVQSGMEPDRGATAPIAGGSTTENDRGASGISVSAVPLGGASGPVEDTERQIDDLLSMSLLPSNGRASVLPQPVAPVMPPSRSRLEPVSVPQPAPPPPMPTLPLAPVPMAPAGLAQPGVEAARPVDVSRPVAVLEPQGGVLAGPASAPVATWAPATAREPVLSPLPATVRESTSAPVGAIAAPKPAGSAGVLAPALAEVPLPVQEDGGLPPAESLAVSDVAQAKRDRLSNLGPVAAEGVAAVVSDSAPVEDMKPVETHVRHKRLPDKPAEQIESTQEEIHNSPTEAQEEAGALTGTLIMPTSEGPAANVDAPRIEQPKKLAPGEVFVDERGNVIIGE